MKKNKFVDFISNDLGFVITITIVFGIMGLLFVWFFPNPLCEPKIEDWGEITSFPEHIHGDLFGERCFVITSNKGSEIGKFGDRQFRIPCDLSDLPQVGERLFYDVCNNRFYTEAKK